jgi:hypothetical protein
MTSDTLSSVYDFLVGRPLEMICIDSTQVYFHFGREDYVCVFDVYALRASEADQFSQACPPDLPASYRMLLDQTVVDINMIEGAIFFEFDTGGALRLGPKQYFSESYRFVCGGRELLVE